MLKPEKMDQQPIHVFAKWQIKEGQLETVLQLLGDVQKQSIEEEGNLFYQVHQSITAPNTLVLFEGYTSEAAVAAHRDSEHFQTIVISKIVPLLENREVTLTTPLF
jgi:autoinducer 2-degrading protein